MVVISAPAIDKIRESFTHNLLTRPQGNPTLLSIMEIQKECIANTSNFESNFGGGQHDCACTTMGKQKYILHSNIALINPRRTGHSPEYPLNHTHREIDVTDQ